jgi:hypothetical protein
MHISISGKNFWRAISATAGERPERANGLLTLSPTEQMLVQQILSARASNGNAVTLPLLQTGEWQAVVRSGREHGLVPVLYDSLSRRESFAGMPPDVMEFLRQSSFRTGLANWLAFQQLGQLLALFERDRIPVVLLKGAALAHTVYADPGLRPMADLDVLVPYAAFPRARAILIEQNYAPILESGDGFDWHFAHAQGFEGRGRQPRLVELHWHLFGLPYYRERVPIEWFWSRTMSARLGERTVRVFSPEAQVLHLAAHLALQHQQRPLVWTFDLALVLSHWRDQIQWQSLIDSARAFELSEVLRSALADVEQVWGATIPDHAWKLLGAHVSLHERLLSAAVTADRVEARDVWDGLLMPGWKGKLGYFRQVLFPGVEYMRTRYHIADMRWVPLYYLARLGKGVLLFLQSGFSMAANVARVLLRSWRQGRAR